MATKIDSYDTYYTAIKADIGSDIHLTGDDIIRYTVDNNLCSEGLPIGVAVSASFSMDFRAQYASDGTLISPSSYNGKKVKVQISITSTDTESYKDFGVWYINEATMTEQGLVISASGCDILGTAGQLQVPDNLKPHFWWDMDFSLDYLIKEGLNGTDDKTKEDYIGLADGVVRIIPDSTSGSDTDPKAIYVIPYALQLNEDTNRPEIMAQSWLSDVGWRTDDQITRQQFIADLALANIGFARINYSGSLEIRTVGWSGSHSGYAYYWDKNGNRKKFFVNGIGGLSKCYEIDPDRYIEYSDSGKPRWYPNAIEISDYINVSSAKTGSRIYRRYGVSSTSEKEFLTTLQSPNCLNSITIDKLSGSNSITSSRFAAVVRTWLDNNDYTGFDSGTVRFIGFPEFMVGDQLDVKKLDDSISHLIANRMSMTYDGGGLITEVECSMPDPVVIVSTTDNPYKNFGFQMQRGDVKAISFSKEADRTSVAIEFPRAFRFVPTVVATIETTANRRFYCNVQKITKTGFSVAIRTENSGSDSVRVHWIAICGSYSLDNDGYTDDDSAEE